jgi:DNA end-binding protein Ku
MGRPIWTGYLSFALVTVPVALHPATVDRTVHFHQLHAGTSHRIRYRKVDEVSGDEIAAEDIVNGFDLGDGEYVLVTRDELKGAAPGKSETIEISDFVELAEIDPIHFRQSYYLAPRGSGTERAYGLLRETLSTTARVGIATMVLRDKEHLVAVRAGDDALIVETMFFADEIRVPRDEIPDLPTEASFAGRELDVAVQLVKALSTDWDPQRYHNTYRERVLEMIAEKREGHEVVQRAEPVAANVVDLMAALEASVAQSQAADGAPGKPTPKRSRRSAATG